MPFIYIQEKSWKNIFLYPALKEAKKPMTMASDPFFKRYLTQMNENFDNLIKIRRIIEKALAVGGIKNLYKQVMSLPSDDHKQIGWKIELNDIPQIRGSFASCHLKERKIYLNRNSSEDMNLSGLVFELINAASSKKFQELAQRARKGEISCEEYVKATEHIEFKNALLHHRLVRQGINEKGWDPKIDLYHHHTKLSFEDYWNRFLKHHPHAERYRQQYARIRTESLS